MAFKASSKTPAPTRIDTYEADSLEHALALARKSPGLKYGFAHEVFPEISLQAAADESVSNGP